MLGVLLLGTPMNDERLQRTSELSLIVINYFFKQRLTQGLHDAALHLSIHQHGINDLSAIVYRNITLEVDFSSFPINLDHGDVRSKREGEILWLEEVRS